MRRIVMWILPLAFVPALWGADPPKDKTKSEKPATPAEQYKALQAEIKTAQLDLVKAFQEAKSEEEKEKIKRQFLQLPQKYAPRLLDLVEKNPKAEFALEALGFVVEKVESGPLAERTSTVILKNFINDERLAEICQMLSARGSPASEKLIREIVEKTSNHKVQAHATLSLAGLIKNKAESSDLKPGEGEKLNKEAEDLYAKVVHQYADVKDVFEQAKGPLFEIQHLAIGKEAPDISGQDGDGKKFKLTDYRGKVVVLDFWANW